jgi:TP53 regulating kinase-like protein
MEKVLSQGAEGKIYLTKFLDKLCLVKERFIKEYRVKELDTKLTKSRILNETRNISRASKNGINVPTIYFVNLIERKIYMEYINNGCQLKEILTYIFQLNDLNTYEKFLEKIINDLGNMISKLHSNGIVHGDLTPSNIILKIKSNENNENNLNSGKDEILKLKNYDYMYLIDFGLSSMTTSNQSGIEDKAVDLYVLKRAMISNNPKSEEVFEKVINIYENNCDNGKKIIEHYKKVEMRGRKRLAFG